MATIYRIHGATKEGNIIKIENALKSKGYGDVKVEVEDDKVFVVNPVLEDNGKIRNIIEDLGFSVKE